jgi:hypothetical protein
MPARFWTRLQPDARRARGKPDLKGSPRVRLSIPGAAGTAVTTLLATAALNAGDFTLPKFRKGIWATRHYQEIPGRPPINSRNTSWTNVLIQPNPCAGAGSLAKGVGARSGFNRRQNVSSCTRPPARTALFDSLLRPPALLNTERPRTRDKPAMYRPADGCVITQCKRPVAARIEKEYLVSGH